MKNFVVPEIAVAELKPAEALMDDITSSAELPKLDNEITVNDNTDEAVW